MFPGNPWPNGHAVTESEFSAVVREDGTLRGHLHLETEDYYANDPDPFNYDDEDLDENDEDVDWKSRIVWNNYHSCSLSSLKWGHDGFPLVTPGQLFDIAALTGCVLDVDPLPFDFDTEPSFGMYAQSGTTTAGHRIHFSSSRETKNSLYYFNIDWTGAMSNLDCEFRHTFYVRVLNIPFVGIITPFGLTHAQAVRLLQSRVADSHQYEAFETERGWVFRPRKDAS